MGETGKEAAFLEGRVVMHCADNIAILGAMGADSVDHVIGDPPYERHMHRAKSGASALARTDGRASLKDLDFSSIEVARPLVTPLMTAAARKWLIAFCTPEGVAPWRDAIEDAGARYKRACVWVKPDAAPQMNGQGPAMGAENFVAAWCGAGHSRWYAGGKRGVYTHLTNAPDRDGRHPTEKPIDLMREILRDFTAEGDLVCDPYAGSGTTAIACILEGRRFIGIEQKPEYFEIACQRIAWAIEPVGRVARRAHGVGTRNPHPNAATDDLFGA